MGKRQPIYLILVLVMTLTLSSTFLDLERVWTDSVTKIMPVGREPQGIAYNSANNNMYVANYGSNTVSVINSSSNTVIKTALLRDSIFLDNIEQINY